MSRTRYRTQTGDTPHFLTCTVVGWLPVFARPEVAQVVIDSWRFLHVQRGLIIFGYVILENHVHLIAAAPDLAKEIGDFKSFTARRIIDLLAERGERMTLQQLAFYKRKHKMDRVYQLWQEGSHPQEIQGEAMMRQKLDYIHENPVRRGYVDEPAHWRYSSARDYEGHAGPVPVMTEW
jgi:REP element-mobilizing transposase RayT